MSAVSEEAVEQTAHPGSALEVLRVFTRLGLTSFGGPIAHLGFFRTEFVEHRRWLDETHYADVVALSQFLPGPASSKVGIIIGVLRAGMPGALAAWVGFTMPSALALILFGYGVAAFGHLGDAAWLHGLKIVAVAVVAQAVWGMARNLCPDRERATIAAAAAVLALGVPSTIGQIGAIVTGGLVGWWHLPGETIPLIPLPVRISRWWSTASILLFFGLLIALPLLTVATGSHVVALFDGFYRSGSLVFGGGHVVLPLLQATVVFTILSAVAEAERDRIRERIRDVKADQRKRKRYLGGIVPFGWQVGQNGELVEIQTEQAAIRRIMDLHREGLSLRAISTMIKGEGINLSHVGVKSVISAAVGTHAQMRIPRELSA